MQEVRLTPTSYIVLGLLQFAGESSPYGLKQLVAGSVGYFWTLQHAQLYTEPERLARGGYVTRDARADRPAAQALRDHREGHARARRVAHGATTSALAELREPALLKLFFGADPAALAEAPAARQPGAARRVRGDPRLDVRRRPARPSARRSSSGIRIERETIAFWEELAGDG